MLRISEIKEYIDEAVDVFKSVYPMAEIPEFIICSPKRAKSIREQAVRECGAINKEFSTTVEAEVIWGPTGTKILFYQSNFFDKEDVCHVTWHELGHVMFGINTKYGITLKQKDTLESTGYVILSEFMAEYIAYTVDNFKPFKYSEKVNTNLQIAFLKEYDGDINESYLSMYLAQAIGDHSIPEEELLCGKTYLGPTVWEDLCYMRKYISKYVENEEFWNADINFIREVGRMYEEMRKNQAMQIALEKMKKKQENGESIEGITVYGKKIDVSKFK